VLVTNAVVVAVACAVTVAVLSPGRLSSVAAEEALVLAGSVGAIYAANLFLLRRAFAPLEQLTRVARKIDPTSPGQRVAVDDQHSEAGELAVAVNEMLARLEDERRESTRRALAAQEAERLRVARELHDEVGQSLTALLLQLDRAAKQAPAPLRDEVGEAQEAARSTLEDVRRIALELRPEALDDLGLISALEALCDRLAQRTGVRVARRLGRDFPALGEEAELVIYRVAQEALTNVVRHSGAATAQLRLDHRADGVTLAVLDDGRGLDPDSERNDGGLRGMRERAMLIGADLSVQERSTGGVAVRLEVPLQEESPWYR
jgi:two-component system, NarL family, sensor histidine kinase UhpB